MYNPKEVPGYTSVKASCLGRYTLCIAFLGFSHSYCSEPPHSFDHVFLSDSIFTIV